ncbi:PIN domain-containing protein [Anabaena azotica]
MDESDTPHVALTLELEGLLWTGDKKLKEGLIRKGFDKFFELNSI